MTTFLLTGLSNAVAASLLAVVAYVVGRRFNSPVLAHSLWLLVLVKLITPPLAPIPIAWIEAEGPDQPSSTPALAAPAQAPPDRQPQPEGSKTPAVSPSDQSSVTAAATKSPIARSVGSKLDPKTGRPLPPVIDKVEPKPIVFVTGPEAEPDDDLGEMSGPDNHRGQIDPSAAIAPAASKPVRWEQVVLGVWLFGALVCGAVTVGRIRRFQRLLRQSSEAPDEWRREFEAIAARMGFRRAPRFRLVPGPVTPMLWAVGRVTIYFPADLFRLLDRDKRETLLVHELAHIKRCDHLVRWLEMLVAVIFWWLPVCRLACGEMRRVEEECCDAWVVDALPGAGKHYAAALLDTIDFLAAGCQPLPGPACGIGRISCIQRRLHSILHGAPSKRLSFAQQVGLFLCACLVLPIAPTVGQIPKPRNLVDQRQASASTAEQRPEPTKFRAQPAGFSPQLEQDPVVLSLAFSPDGKTLAVGAESNLITLWDVRTHARLATLAGHADAIAGLAFSPDGNTIASASYDKTIKIWDAASRSELQTLTGHTKWVFAVAFSPDGSHLASASYDRSIRVWNLRTGDVEAELRGHGGGVRAVAFSPEGRQLVSGGADHTVRVWRLDEDSDPVIFRGHQGPVRSVAFHPDGRTIASGGENLRIWDVPSGAQRQSWGDGGERIGSVAFSPRGTTLAVGMWNGSVRVLDPNTLEQHSACLGPNEAVTAVAISPDGRRIAAGGYDRLVFSWPSTKEQAKPPSPTDLKGSAP